MRKRGRRPPRPAIVLLALVLLPMSAVAAHRGEGFWSLQVENDLFGDNSDRFYTNGWQLSFASAARAPSALRRLSDSLPFYRKGNDGFFGYHIGQQVFTPEDIKTAELIEDDRPYAGFLYAETFIGHRYFDAGDRERINGLILTIGVVGPASLAEDTQKLVHELFDSDDPRGWDNQLDNELGFSATYIHKWRYLFALDRPRQFEFGWHTNLRVGNVYTYAATGFMTRWGTHLKDDVGPPSIKPGFPGLPAFNPKQSESWYLFAGLEARAVAHNIFLDGNTNVDSHSVDKRTLVGDLLVGVALQWDDVRIAFSQILRSREFDGQSEREQFGAINFTLHVD